MLVSRQRKSSKFITAELVRVRSKDKIRNAIDHKSEREGCVFMEQMWQYCGNTYKIFRVIHSIFDEQHKRTLRPKSQIYILEGLICDGKMNQFQIKCDRSCFLFWHEDWLEKAQQPSSDDSRIDQAASQGHDLLRAEMCQLQLIKQIGHSNSWSNDKLQYSIRKLRWYKKWFHVRCTSWSPVERFTILFKIKSKMVIWSGYEAKTILKGL